MLTVIGHAKYIFEITQFNPPTPHSLSLSLSPLVLNPFPFILLYRHFYVGKYANK